MFIPHTEKERQAMLSVIGAKSMDELFKVVPEAYRYPELALPPMMTEMEVVTDLQNIAAENTPIKRFATPEELADFFVFLCSPRASYCVGSTYYVDGGWLKVV